jgi:hypothetical protein
MAQRNNLQGRLQDGRVTAQKFQAKDQFER